MNIIIAGGSGLIGQALIQALTNQGHSIWVLSRNPQQMQAIAGVEWVQWNAQTTAGWGHLVEQADAILNLAGENIGAGLWTPQRVQRILSSRVNAGKAITQAVQQANHKPQVLIQASAVGFYGNSADAICTEDAPAGSGYLPEVCLQWEAATQPVEALGVRRVVLRTGLVLTANEGVLPRLILPFKLMVGGPLGSGKQYYPWIHLADEVGAIRFLLENLQAQGVFNLSAPNPLPMAEFGKVLAKVLKRPYWLPVPGFALRLLLGNMSALVLEGQRAVPQRLLAQGYPFHFPELQGALQDLLN